MTRFIIITELNSGAGGIKLLGDSDVYGGNSSSGGVLLYCGFVCYCVPSSLGWPLVRSFCFVAKVHCSIWNIKKVTTYS